MADRAGCLPDSSAPKSRFFLSIRNLYSGYFTFLHVTVNLRGGPDFSPRGGGGGQDDRFTTVPCPLPDFGSGMYLWYLLASKTGA